MKNLDSKLLSHNEEVLLVFGKEHGKEAWYFVSVNKLKKPILLNMFKKSHYDLCTVGTILESGWGAEPPQTSRDKWLT